MDFALYFVFVRGNLTFHTTQREGGVPLSRFHTHDSQVAQKQMFQTFPANRLLRWCCDRSSSTSVSHSRSFFLTSYKFHTLDFCLHLPWSFTHSVSLSLNAHSDVQISTAFHTNSDALSIGFGTGLLSLDDAWQSYLQRNVIMPMEVWWFCRAARSGIPM